MDQSHPYREELIRHLISLRRNPFFSSDPWSIFFSSDFNFITRRRPDGNLELGKESIPPLPAELQKIVAEMQS